MLLLILCTLWSTPFPIIYVADVLIWSGIEKGPPRKEKFPEPETLIRALKAAL
jgi:hypothetical protein